MNNILLEFPGTNKKKNSSNSTPVIKLYKYSLFHAFNLSNYRESQYREDS